MNKRILTILAGTSVALTLAACSTSPDKQSKPVYTTPATLSCKMTYSLKGWSIIYKHAEGVGTVTCANGQSMAVKLEVTGGGLTAGKWHVADGKGTFSDVHQISDVLGSYAQGSAHAGVVHSGSAQVLTKGEVSLALAGTGRGVDLGVDAGKFTISRR
ncbi:MAG TPA: hypothetical protein VF271_04005 [Rhodanobacteraceae bacterium]